MKGLIGAAAICVVGTSVLADAPRNQGAVGSQQSEEKLVFVTGSLIPQRVKMKKVTTNTMSPIRVIDREEIDHKGRRTTAGSVAGEPSLHVIGR